MTGPTHRQYSVCFAYLTAILFFNIGATKINYYFTIPILLWASKAGALFPDLDHAWVNISNKNVPNKIINTLIHITGGKHRSWQTHSIDICTVFTVCSYIVPKRLGAAGILSDVNQEVMSLILLGFASGWISHLFSDMLTSEGVRLLCFMKMKVKFVPKQIFGFRFNTGNEWEKFNFTLVKYINIVLGLLCIAYPVILKYLIK